MGGQCYRIAYSPSLDYNTMITCVTNFQWRAFSWIDYRASAALTHQEIDDHYSSLVAVAAWGTRRVSPKHNYNGRQDWGILLWTKWLERRTHDDEKGYYFSFALALPVATDLVITLYFYDSEDIGRYVVHAVGIVRFIYRLFIRYI